MVNTSLNQLFYQAEDYFFRSLSFECLNFEREATAYNSYVESPHFNFLCIQRHIVTLENILSQSRSFYKAKKLPWMVTICETIKSQLLEEILHNNGFHLSEKTTAMYFDLTNEVPILEENNLTIQLNNTNLNQWMIPLISAFQSSPKITEQYIEAHQRALLRQAHLHHYTLYESEIPVSSLTLSLNNTSARLDDIGTMQQHQNKGHAKRLILNALLHAKKAGARHCFLEASSLGLSLYQRIGFKSLFQNLIYTQ